MSLNWNFHRGGGFKPKTPSVGEVWIFSGTTQWYLNYQATTHEEEGSEMQISFLPVFLKAHFKGKFIFQESISTICNCL